jgi:hypothetical protein
MQKENGAAFYTGRGQMNKVLDKEETPQWPTQTRLLIRIWIRTHGCSWDVQVDRIRVTLHGINFLTRPVVIYYFLKFPWNNQPTRKIISYSATPPHRPQAQAHPPRLSSSLLHPTPLLGGSSLLLEELVYTQLE